MDDGQAEFDADMAELRELAECAYVAVKSLTNPSNQVRKLEQPLVRAYSLDEYFDNLAREQDAFSGQNWPDPAVELLAAWRTGIEAA